MLAIDRGKPRTFNLKELIVCYIEHRREVVLRRAGTSCGMPSSRRSALRAI